MEMERYKNMPRTELWKEFESNPVFDYMKLVYEISDIPKVDFDGQMLFSTDGDFDIFWRYIIGQFHYSFSFEDLQHPKVDNYAAKAINTMLTQGGLDIEKFWWAMVLIFVYSDSIFKRGYSVGCSIKEQFEEVANILSGNNAVLTCECDGVKKHSYTNAQFLGLLSNTLQSILTANNGNDNPLWSGIPVHLDEVKNTSNTYRQIFFECQLYIALFKKLEDMGTLPKASFDRYVMLAELMKFTERTYNANFDKEDISGILNKKVYKADPTGGLTSNLGY